MSRNEGIKAEMASFTTLQQTVGDFVLPAPGYRHYKVGGLYPQWKCIPIIRHNKDSIKL